MNLQPLDDRFRFKTAAALIEKAASIGVSVPFRDDIGVLLQPTPIGDETVPNRIAAQPMEGCDAEPTGAPSDLTLRRYRRIAEGGSGLVWVEATSVVLEGRASPRQLLLTADTAPAFERLADLIRGSARQRFGGRQSPYLVLQLTHSGRFSRTAPSGSRKVACANPFLDRERLPEWQDAELERVRDAHVDAARLAARAGFNAVDIKACHGYLFHELLGAHNRVDSPYGGQLLANRARLLLETVAAVRAENPTLAVAVRLGVTGGAPYPYGFGMAADGSRRDDLSEPRQLARQLADLGCAIINVSAGIPTFDPHVGRPFDRPVSGTTASPEHPLVGVIRLLTLAGVIQTEIPRVPVVATGLSWLRQFWPHVASEIISTGRAAFAGLGRGIFAYPDAPADLMDHGALSPAKCCIACSRCTELMRSGSTPGCAVRDRPLYWEIHREAIRHVETGG